MNEQIEMMGHLCAVVDVLFCQVNPMQVLRKEAYFDSFTCQDVSRLLVEDEEDYHKSRTAIECSNITDCLNRYMASRDDMRLRTTKPGLIHVFELLSDVVDHLLLLHNGEVVCYYNHILQWRSLVHSIGEELPVTAMYTLTDMAAGRGARSHFDWDYVIGHNNEPLNQLLRQGISDHHLHLWVSMPYFQVSWINLMNYVKNSSYIRKLQQIDEEDWSLRQERRRAEGKLPDRRYSCRSDALTAMHLQAALIRVYLCARLQGRLLQIAPRDAIADAKDGKPRGEELTAQEYAAAMEQQREWDLDYVYYLLNSPQQLYMETSHIQSIIASFQGLDMRPYLDYAHRMSSGGVLEDQPIQLAYAGERWFLSSMLRDIYLSFPSLGRGEHNLFYAYLMLQLRIRKKMVQVEDQIGFDYFQKLQRRKGYFIGDAASTQLVMRLAIRTPLRQKPHLQEIEARITPRDQVEDLYQDICNLESTSQEDSVWVPLSQTETAREQDSIYSRLSQEELKEQEALKRRYYYVLHFTKKQDDSVLSTEEPFTFDCRHAQYRKELERQADAILALRMQYPAQAMRVLGIDACSQEIGCRPENFAYVFRLLSNHSCTWNDCGTLHKLPMLRMTFHVGEDFLDLADGLRAIDEAVRFLNLDCGDRLGHALALGLKPRVWYESKNRQIFLPKQDYLDNLMWLYFAIHHYHLAGLEGESRFLKQQFERYFREIYLNHIDPEEMRGFMQAAVNQYAGKPYARDYSPHDCSFTIEDYMRSWMLRGDHPSLYHRGYFWQERLAVDGLEDKERWKRNERFPADSGIRYIPECSYLNFCYHYNTGVRKTGSEKCTITVDERYIRAVEAVQRAFQFDIASRGLSVESNPTSNLKISPIQSYLEHPMTNLFNRGLYHSDQSLRNCPQVPISINTDDGGLFFTSLENEYAVMARALELRCDEQEKSLYYKWEIYDWVDAVRKNGNNQSFQSR